MLGSQPLAGLIADEPLPRDPLAALVGAALHASLLQPNPETAALEPALAGEWEVAGNRVTFRLREGVTWSDETPITAAEVAESLLAARDAGRGRSFWQITEASAADARTVEVLLDAEPAPCGTVSEIASWPIVDAAGAETSQPPERTSGAYSVAPLPEGGWRFRPRSEARADSAEWPPTPALGEWSYHQISDTEILAAWRQGNFDLIAGDRWLHGADLPPGAAGAQLADVLGRDLAVLAFRLDQPLLSEDGLRAALALGTDPAALWERVYDTPAPPPMTALLPPNHWAAPPDGPAPDVEAAAEGLEALGWIDADGDGIRERDGVPLRLGLTIGLSQDPRWEALALALREQWARLGVDLEPRYIKPGTLEELLHGERWDLALLAYNVPLDPDQGALWQPPSTGQVAEDVNLTGFDNPEAAALAMQAATLPGCDPAERASLYHEFWGLVQEEAPMIFLFPLPQRLFLGPDLAPPPLAGWPWQLLYGPPARTEAN